jgi:hypothetical protein
MSQAEYAATTSAKGAKPMNTATDTLNANLDKLTANDRRFAVSLLSSRNPSAKQLHWIGVLAERATAPVEDRTAGEVQNVSGIVALISRGGEKLKRPAILFEAAGQELRLSIAGERSAAPGSINVTCSDKGFDARQFFGRIHRDGRFEASRRNDAATTTAIMAALTAFAADPAGVAAEFGRRTGCCCFCAKDLTDPVSIEVGYGPTCARNYGLPHRATGLRPGMQQAA